MNMVLLNTGDWISESSIRLSGRRFAHITAVLKAQCGDRFAAGLLNGNSGNAVIESIAADHLIARVELPQAPPPPVPIRLLLALPRPKALKRVLQGITALGIKEIVLFSTWKVEKSYWQSPILNAEGLAEQISLGLEQSGDTIPPHIEMRRLFKPFMEDEAPAWIQDRLALVADPYAETVCPARVELPVTLAVGPEGGFTDYELQLMQEIGFLPISLGTRILRVEQAVPALIGRLMG